MSAARSKAVVVCPGRGTYNKPELGYLARHHARRVKKTVERLDPASSGRFFDGWRWRPVPDGRRAHAFSGAPVARPHTWLMAKGWRRLGLLDPSEIPGKL